MKITRCSPICGRKKTGKKGKRGQEDRKGKGSRRISTEKVLEVEKGLWKSRVEEDVSA